MSNTKQFRIVATPFGYPMYATLSDCGWSDVAADAVVYDGRDNPEIKAAYWRGHLSGVCGLDASTVTVEII